MSRPANGTELAIPKMCYYSSPVFGHLCRSRVFPLRSLSLAQLCISRKELSRFGSGKTVRDLYLEAVS